MGTYTNGKFNGGIHFICARLKIPLLGKFDLKNQNCWFKLKFGTCAISNMQNSGWCSLFQFFLPEMSFWVNLVQEIEITSLSWNLVPKRIQICSTLCTFFVFSTGNTLFGQIWSKTSKRQFKLKFGTKTNFNMKNSILLFTFFRFGQIWSKKNQKCSV